MSHHRSKRKKSPVLEYRRQPTEELRRQIQQACERGNVRAAVEMAKECHRREPTDAHAQLLSGLHVQRARQLMEKNLHTEAAVVLSHALATGQGTEELLRLVFECSLRSGQYQSAIRLFDRLRDPVERARARSLLAEEAIARGEELERLCEPSIRDDAGRIRRAFAAFARGEDETVAAELKSLGLSSPCAGWKWILLGLVAYAKNDEARARACWERNGFGGQANRLCALLRSALDVGQHTHDPRAPGPPRLHLKLMADLGTLRLEMLQRIKDALDQNDTAEVLRLATQLIAALSPEERTAFSPRLARVVCSSLDWSNLDPPVVQRIFGRVPEDPKLTRVLALWFEHREPALAVYLWREYLDELQRLPLIPGRLKPRARAMVWKRMGELTERTTPYDLAEAEEDLYGYRTSPIDPVLCYRNSIKYDPHDRQAHQKLLEVLIARGSRKSAERQAEEILNRWPNDVQSLLFLGRSCFERDAMRKALKYFDRARQAEPFNAKVRVEMITCLLFSARRRLDMGHVEPARRDYEQAEALATPGETNSALYCKWAALEWRAGDGTRAEALLAKALAGESGSLPVCYQMAVEAARAPVPPDVNDRIERRLAQEWRNEPTSADAMELVGCAVAHATLRINYDGQDMHLGELARYLERASRKVSFSEDQVLLICNYLGGVSDWQLLEVYAQQGAALCPGNYYFPLYLGRAQMDRLRGRLPRETRALLDRAGRQASQAGDLRTAAELAAMLAAAAQRRIPHRMLEALGGIAARLGFADPLDFANDNQPPWRRRRRRFREDASQLRLFNEPAKVELQTTESA